MNSLFSRKSFFYVIAVVIVACTWLLNNKQNTERQITSPTTVANADAKLEVPTTNTDASPAKATKGVAPLADASAALNNEAEIPAATKIIKSLHKRIGSKEQASLPKDSFDQLHKLNEGESFSFDLEGQTFSGTVKTIARDHVFRKYLLKLNNNVGVVTFNFIQNDTVQASLFFNDESDAFLLESGPKDTEIKVTASSVSDIYCAPIGTKYPLHRAGIPLVQEAPVASATPVPGDGAIPLLESKPDSAYVIYLDFDGEIVVDPRWNDGEQINALPFPNATNGSWVQAVFRRVSEDFASFDVNVTTSEAVFEAASPIQRIQCVCTSTADASPSAGGVAYVGSFGEGSVCWAFNSSEYTNADTISHEIGHTLGLRHDGQLDETGVRTVEYYAGHGTGETSWSPIMGAGFGRFDAGEPFFYPNVTQWSLGEYTRPSNTEDDFNIIVTENNGLTYRDDDHADDLLSAAPLNVDPVSLEIYEPGYIERNTDEDWFAFISEGGPMTIIVDTLDVMSEEDQFGSDTYGSNLAPEVSLFDSDGTLIVDNTPITSLSATIDTTIAAGLFYVRVKGGAVLTPEDGFSTYGSVGEYIITGNIPLGPVGIFGGNSLDRFIGKNDVTPSLADNTHMGFAAVGGNGSSKTYRISNLGVDPLQLTSLTSDSPNFVISNFIAGTLVAGQSLDFTILFQTTEFGNHSANISLSYTDDAAETYNFQVAGSGSTTDGDDSYEQNNTFFNPYDLSNYPDTPISTLITVGFQKDNDWYKITVPAGFNTINLQADYIHDLGNIDFALYDQNGRLLASATDTEGTETEGTDLLDYLIPHTDGAVFYIRAYSAIEPLEDGSLPQTYNIYDLEWNYDFSVVIPPALEDNYEENDLLTLAYVLPTAGVPLSAIDGLGTQLDNDWYRIQTPDGDNVLTVDCTFVNDDGDIDIAIYNEAMYLIADSTGTTDDESLFIPISDIGQIYYINVRSGETTRTGNTYDLLWSTFYTDAQDDFYERNDTIGDAQDILTAANLRLSEERGLGIQRNDDWFVINPNRNRPIVIVRAEFIHEDGDINLEVYNSEGDIMGSGTTILDNEFVSIEVHGQGPFFIRVFGDDTGNTYDLYYEELSDDNYESNNSTGTAYDLSEHSGVFLSKIEGGGVMNNSDYYEYVVPLGSTSLFVELFFLDAEGDIDVRLLGPNGNEILRSAGVTDNEFMLLLPGLGEDTIDAGSYFIHVYPWIRAEGNAYNMVVSVEEPPPTPPPAPEDNYEENDLFGQGTSYDVNSIRGGLLSDIDGTGTQLDNNDWYTFTVPSGENLLTVSALFTHYAEGDINMALYNSNGTPIITADSATDNESITTLLPAAGGVYYVRIYGVNAGIIYDLTWDAVAPPPDDAFENNDSYATPASITDDADELLDAVQLDEDWYTYTSTPADSAFYVMLSTTVELSLRLYRNGALVEESSGSDGITIFAPSSTTANDIYTFRVDGGDMGTPYVLTWGTFSAAEAIEDDGFEDNDTYFNAYDLSDSPDTPLSVIIEEGIYLNNDWYVVSVPAGNNAISVEGITAESGNDFRFHIYDQNGRLQTSRGNGQTVSYSVNPDAGGTVYIRVSSDYYGASYDLQWSPIPVGTNVPLESEELSDDNADGDKLPNWAEYVLNLDPAVFSSDIIRQFEQNNYIHLQFQQRKDAIDGGYEVVVKESPTLSFSSQEAVWVSTETSPDDANIQIVTYRCSSAIGDAPKCFFMLEVNKPE